MSLDVYLTAPDGSAFSKCLGPLPRLVACPLCGADKGYTLTDGSTYRWWLVSCASCGDDLGECHADRTLKNGAAKPALWEWADEHWNKVGAYAQGLRDAMPNLLPVIQWLENGCDPKEAAKELRVYQQMMMTTGPEEVKCPATDEGPGGMPLALRLSDQLGRLRDLLLAYSDIRQQNPRESRYALSALLTDELRGIDQERIRAAQAMDVLRAIASMKRRTREQRLASSCVAFIDSLDKRPNARLSG